MIAVLAAAVQAGCAINTRHSRSEAELLAARSGYFIRLQESGAAPQRALVDRIATQQLRFQRGAASSPATLDVLIISGGGDYGAFGAGFLKGWGTVPAGDMARPEFEAVTGVSTGALIAPLAFIGDDAAFERLDHLYRNPKPDWVREHGLLTFLLVETPYFDTSGLEREVRSTMNTELIAQVAEGARQGRALAVSATNIDYGVRHVFILSQMALEANQTGNIAPFQNALLASSAIPIAFAPRESEGSLFVDGGLTSNVLFSGDPEMPSGFTGTWRRLHPSLPMPRLRYWVIVNNQMIPPPEIVQPRWSAIGGPTVETAIRSSTAASLREISLLVRLQRAVGIDSEFRWICIPDEWRAPVKGMFKEETMKSLADLGQTMGSKPTTWRTIPPE